MSTKQLVRFLDSVLIKEAESAFIRLKAAQNVGDSVVQGGAAFSAVIAATCATEAYLSELLAHLQAVGFISRDEREEIRRGNGLWAKFNALAKKFGKEIDGLPVYRRYEALVNVRNCLVHRSAEFLEPGEWPSRLAPFKSVIPHASGDGLDWTSEVYSAATAEWAIKVAREFLVAVDDYIPDPGRMTPQSSGADA